MTVLLPLLLAVSLRADLPRALDLRLDDRQDGASHRLQVGDRFTVELAADAGSRLQWDLIEPPMQQIVRQVGHVEVAKAGDKRGLALRIQRWTFEAAGVGGQRLRFDLRRPGEARREPERLVSFVIEVQDEGQSP